MWIELEYCIPGYAASLDGGLEFRSPAWQLVLSNGSFFRAATSDWPEQRETDVFPYFNGQDVNESIKLPGKLKLEGDYEQKPIDEIYAAFNADLQLDGGTLKFSGRAEVRRRQIPPDGYTGFREAMSAARTWGEKTHPYCRPEEGGKHEEAHSWLPWPSWPLLGYNFWLRAGHLERFRSGRPGRSPSKTATTCGRVTR